MNKGIKFTVSSSVSLNPVGILQEKLLKRMSSLWKMREEIQISLNEEANTTQSFEVRIKMFLFICINIDVILPYIFFQVSVSSCERLLVSSLEEWFQMTDQ